MRLLPLLLATLPLCAQGWNAPCGPSPETLKLLEAIPPLDDLSIPYEQRIGALRRLAVRYQHDFFIQRAYQDSFRRRPQLGEEFDRAAMFYRLRSDSMAAYWLARLLMKSDPAPARQTFDALLKEHPEFVWPHLEYVEWSALPGRRGEGAEPHIKAFLASCPEAPAAGAPGMTQDAAAMRRGLERRNSWLEAPAWPELWVTEEKAGIGAEALRTRVRADLKRIESWPFRADPRLRYVYREAARILHDQSVVEPLRAQVEREAPASVLAALFHRDDWDRANPGPTPDDPKAYRDYEDKRAAAEREWLRRWSGDYISLQDLFMRVESRAYAGAPVGSAEDLDMVDRWVRFKLMSPDVSIQVPPLETTVARIYVAGKVRLEQVGALLDLGLRNIEVQEKYRISRELVPPELLRRVNNDGPELTAFHTEQIRADYFLAVNRFTDARAIVEPALRRLEGQQGSRVPFDRNEWTRRLADVEAAEGRAADALAHYQATLGIPKDRLAAAESQPRVGAIKRYYLAHGGSEAEWPEWASAKMKPAARVERTPPAFTIPVPEFSARDLAGRTWQLRDLNGKATLVNYWATWCGPCRTEHSAVQKLYDSIRGRADIQVLTFSVDESPGAVRDYVKEKGYTFPVIHAPDLADKLFPYVGLPTNFLVNAKGVRTGMYGFGGDEEGMRRVMEDLESLRR